MYNAIALIEPKLVGARGSRSRLPILGGLIALTGLIGLRLTSRLRRRRPTGAQLLGMTDAEFAAFIRSSGIKTRSTPELAAPDGTGD